MTVAIYFRWVVIGLIQSAPLCGRATKRHQVLRLDPQSADRPSKSHSVHISHLQISLFKISAEKIYLENLPLQLSLLL
jgi:hypothetical protein